jgi:hypothetical protein
MAEERDDATQVGHQVVGEGEPQAAPDYQGPPREQGAEGTEVFFSRDAAQQNPGVSTPPTPPAPSSESEGQRGGSSPAEADRISADEEDSFARNPLPYVGGAFVGAIVFAQILKRITGGGDD